MNLCYYISTVINASHDVKITGTLWDHCGHGGVCDRKQCSGVITARMNQYTRLAIIFPSKTVMMEINRVELSWLQ
jgi:hypothetical protein